MSFTGSLPSIIEKLIAAVNAHDTKGFVDAFAPDAVIDDWGHQVVGHDEIRAWKVETSAKYRVTVEPLESRSAASKTIVVAKVSGTFPGSPANLTYRFDLSADGRIGSLEIR